MKFVILSILFALVGCGAENTQLQAKTNALILKNKETVNKTAEQVLQVMLEQVKAQNAKFVVEEIVFLDNYNLSFVCVKTEFLKEKQLNRAKVVLFFSKDDEGNWQLINLLARPLKDEEVIQ